jgi:hypothetical protein
MDTHHVAPTASIEPPWIAPPRRALPWFRLGVAGALVAGCAWRGLGMDCGYLPDVREVVTVLALLATQGATALGSFGTSLLACARRDWGRARAEAIVGVLMLLAIPLGFGALLSTAPGCPC